MNGRDDYSAPPLPTTLLNDNMAVWDQYHCTPLRGMKGRLSAQIYVAIKYHPGFYHCWNSYLADSTAYLQSGFQMGFPAEEWHYEVLFHTMLLLVENLEGRHPALFMTCPYRRIWEDRLVDVICQIADYEKASNPHLAHYA